RARRVVAGEVAEGARGELGAALAGDWAVGTGLGHGSPALLPARQIRVAAGAGTARVRHRAQLTDQAQLLERRLELRAEHAPLDAVESSESGFHGGSLAGAREVGTQPRPKLTRLADVQN